jgi:hypothetical protein
MRVVGAVFDEEDFDGLGGEWRGEGGGGHLIKPLLSLAVPSPSKIFVVPRVEVLQTRASNFAPMIDQLVRPAQLPAVPGR